MSDSTKTGEILLSGATGFVGRYLYPALVAAGYSVRCGLRLPEKARSLLPGRNWVQLDVENRESIASAMRGCQAAFFLVHGMGHGKDYPEHEKKSAELFAGAANQEGLSRIVYLGGVVPSSGKLSRHLRSRQQTGEILRSRTSTVELRAAMIIGNGSASWIMVRDLAARLPAMILPRWLKNVSYPIFIEDVIAALLESLLLPGSESQCLDLPGPERITHRDMLNRTAAAMGHERVMVNVPVLSPRLSSYWIALVTAVDLSLAQELVEGVRYDLEPTGAVLWDLIDRKPTPLEDTVRFALADDRLKNFPSPRAIERLRTLGETFKHRRSDE